MKRVGTRRNTKRRVGDLRWRITELEGLVHRMIRPFRDTESQGIELEELRYLTHAIRLRADRLYNEKGHGPHEEARLCSVLLNAYSLLTVPPEDEVIRKRCLLARSYRVLAMLPKGSWRRRGLMDTLRSQEPMYSLSRGSRIADVPPDIPPCSAN